MLLDLYFICWAVLLLYCCVPVWRHSSFELVVAFMILMVKVV